MQKSVENRECHHYLGHCVELIVFYSYLGYARWFSE